MRKRILITGAAGRIGGYLAKHLANKYDLVLTDIRLPSTTYGLPFYQIDIGDTSAVRKAFDEIDIVIHLAANANQNAPWEDLYLPNIVGTYNVFQASADADCERVVFASSVHTVLGYPAGVKVQSDMPVRPLNIYGATKVWGETLARFYSDQKKMSIICLRIGGVSHRSHPGLELNNPDLDLVITFNDLLRLFVASIEADPKQRFGIFHGLSDNRLKRLDISDTCERLDYHPRDDAFNIAEK